MVKGYTPPPPNPWRISDETPPSATESAMLKAIPETAQPATPLHQHSAFADIQAALIFIGHANAALLGIGDLLQPVLEVHDNQLNNAHCSSVSAIFHFFGEAMEGHIEKAYNANEALQREAKAWEGAQ